MQVHQCAQCSAMLTSLGSVCPKCLSREVRTVEVPGQGTLASWTTIRRAPAGYPVAAPYDVVVVDLAPGLRVTGRLAADSPPPAMGAPVRQVAQEGSCPVFAVAAG